MARYFLCVHPDHVNWLNRCRGIIRAKMNGDPVQIKVCLPENRELDEKEKAVLAAHPEWVEVKEKDTIIGSVAAKDGRVKLPELPPNFIWTHQVRMALEKEPTGEREVFLVGRIFLNDRGYQALILSDEDSDNWMETSKEDLLNPKAKEVKQVSLKNTHIRSHFVDGAEHAGKAFLSGAMFTIDVVKWTLPILGKGLKGIGKVSQVTGNGLSRVGKTLDK